MCELCDTLNVQIISNNGMLLPNLKKPTHNIQNMLQFPKYVDLAVEAVGIVGSPSSLSFLL